MIKFKIAMICLFLSIISNTKLEAQENKTTMDLLTQKAWKTERYINKDYNITTIWVFSKNEFTKKNISKDGEFEILFKYYLSNVPDTTFNPDKVGKTSNGQYIIALNKFSDIFIYEIGKVSDQEFEIYVLSKKELVRDKQKIVKYQAIPKP